MLTFQNKTKKIERACEHCKAIFVTWPHLIDMGKGKYCSQACSNRHNAKEKVSPIQCIECSKDFKASPSRIKMGKGKFCSQSCSNRSNAKRGKDSPNWRGGTSWKYSIIRVSRKYKNWRMSVYRRDCFTCIQCGYRSKQKGDIHADHIKSFADYPELRFDVDNGRVLCVPCHKKTPTWGFRKDVIKC